MSWPDIVLTLGFAVVWPAWVMRRHGPYRARVQAGEPCARLAAYAEGVITQWLLAAALMALWIHFDRSWSEIGLAQPTGWSGLGAAVSAAVLGTLLIAQVVMVARRPSAHEEARAVLADDLEILPVRRSDLSGFAALAMTAGVCEELLFRGYLPWMLGHGLGMWGGQAGALLLFALAHAYLGRRAVVRALLAGAVAAGLYIWSGSLVPSMLLHALVDLTSGGLGYLVLGGAAGTPPAQTAPSG